MKELIFAQVRDYVTPYSSTTDVTMKTNFAKHTCLDSLNLMDMIMELEDDFNVTLPINVLSDVQTVGDLVDLVYNKANNIETAMG
jgi:acyl carrier protein